MDIGSTGLRVLTAPDALVAAVALPDTAQPGTSTAYRRAKRSIDVVFSLLVLLVTVPVWLIVAVLVRTTSSGPVFFRQPRVGRNGRSFTVLKFRSMCSDAEARLKDLGLYDTYVATGYKLPVADECRVTRVGRILRKTSLDELPQLINVLRGDMSLVGPRPIVQMELRQYAERGAAAAYLNSRPGLTGLWQVSGRNRLGYDARVQLDLMYLASASLASDAKILLRTPFAVLRRDGAH